MSFPIARFEGKRDNQATQVHCEWDELKDLLTVHEIRGSAGDDGKDGPAWAPAVFREGRRLAQNVEAVTCFVLDFDGGTKPDAFYEKWAGWSYVIYSSHNNKPEHPKWRAVFPLAQPVPGDQWRQTWEKLACAFEVAEIVDKACKDPSRLYYLPSCSEETEPYCFSRSNEGEWLDPEEFPDLEPTKKTQNSPHTNGAKGSGSVPDRALNFVRNGYPNHGQRIEACAVARSFIAAGYGIEATEELIWQGLQNCPQLEAAPWSRKDAETIVRTISNSAPSTPLRKVKGGNGKPKSAELPEIEPGDQQPALVNPEFNRTELGNGERMVFQYGDRLRYVKAWSMWLVYDGKRWRDDDDMEAERLAKKVARSVFAEAMEASSKDEAERDAKWALASESGKVLRNTLEMAKSEKPIACVPSNFDQDLWLLNCSNGTLDLRTGDLRPHNPEDHLRKLAPVSYHKDAECPRWMQFLDEVMQGDQELVEFLQRAVGYALTGVTREHCLFILYGTGRNGKSVFLNTVRNLLGDYSKQTEFRTFTPEAENKSNRDDLADLVGARLVTASEANQGKRLDEAIVKQITGEDPVTCSKKYQNSFTYKPQYKIFLAANHLPTIKGTDPAIWSRIRTVPFERRFLENEQDKKLEEKLRRELPGILRWAVEGCLRWQAEGLGQPQAVREATEGYREEMDVLGIFIQECCEVGPRFQGSNESLYNGYLMWCERSGERHMSSIEFGRKLSDRDFLPGKSSGKRYRKGIQIRHRGMK